VPISIPPGSGSLPLLGSVLGVISTGLTVILWVGFSSCVEEIMLPFQAAFFYAGMACLFVALGIVFGCLTTVRRDEA